MINVCIFLVIIPWTVQYNNYLQSICIVQGIVNHLEMIQSVWEDVHRFCRHTVLFCEGLKHLLVSMGVLEPVWYCLILSDTDEWLYI